MGVVGSGEGLGSGGALVKLCLVSCVVCRGNQLGVTGWADVAEALEQATALTSLNECDQYAAIRSGGLKEMNLGWTELAVWAMLFLERSASTLTKLDVRL